MAKARGRRDRSEAANPRREATRMGTEAAVHGHAHIGVDAVAREVARYVLHHPRRDEARAAKAAAIRQHLVESCHGPRRGVAAAAGNAGAAPSLGVLLFEAHLLAAILAGAVHLRRARSGALGQAHIKL